MIFKLTFLLQTFLFSRLCFCLQDFVKIIRRLLATVSINGLSYIDCDFQNPNCMLMTRDDERNIKIDHRLAKSNQLYGDAMREDPLKVDNISLNVFRDNADRNATVRDRNNVSPGKGETIMLLKIPRFPPKLVKSESPLHSLRFGVF